MMVQGGECNMTCEPSLHGPLNRSKINDSRFEVNSCGNEANLGLLFW
jgi:hypothetical protein